MYKNGKCKQNKSVKVVKALDQRPHQKHTYSQKESGLFKSLSWEHPVCVCP